MIETEALPRNSDFIRDSSQLRRNYRVSLFLRRSYIVIDCAISRSEREKGKNGGQEEETSHEIDSGGWNGRIEARTRQGEKGRERERKREGPRYLRKSRANLTRAEPQVFSPRIYTPSPS